MAKVTTKIIGGIKYAFADYSWFFSQQVKDLVLIKGEKGGTYIQYPSKRMSLFIRDYSLEHLVLLINEESETFLEILKDNGVEWELPKYQSGFYSQTKDRKMTKEQILNKWLNKY